jgi:hypothetical protein
LLIAILEFSLDLVKKLVLNQAMFSSDFGDEVSTIKGGAITILLMV